MTVTQEPKAGICLSVCDTLDKNHPRTSRCGHAVCYLHDGSAPTAVGRSGSDLAASSLRLIIRGPRQRQPGPGCTTYLWPELHYFKCARAEGKGQETVTRQEGSPKRR